MSCVCSVSEATQRDRAAMCLVCPEGVRQNGDVVLCSVNGQPVASMIRSSSPACPQDHHDEEPFWFGFRWIGVPMPVRLWLYLFHKKRPSPSSFSGCGCIRALKRLAKGVSTWLTRET